MEIYQLNSAMLIWFTFFLLLTFTLLCADCTFIHSKFIAPLPPEVKEFTKSLRTVFPHVIDVNQMMKKIGSFKKLTSIPAALSHLKHHFFAPVDMEIPDQGKSLNLCASTCILFVWHVKYKHTWLCHQFFHVHYV